VLLAKTMETTVKGIYCLHIIQGKNLKEKIGVAKLEVSEKIPCETDRF